MKEGAIVCKGLGASLAPVEILQERGMDTPLHETRADKAGPRTHTKDEQYETNIATAFQQSFFTRFWFGN